MSILISSHIRANIVGYIAVFLALGGVSYAAGLAPNSVKSKHIKSGQVKNSDIGSGAVSASKVAGNSLGGDQINEANLAGSYRLPQSCTNGQVAKSNGAGTWNCAADSNGGGGTTYSARANGGLSLAANAFGLIPCAAGQVLKSTGSSNWACAADSTGTGGPPTGAAGGDLTGTYPNPTIAAGKVNSAKVADESLTGHDIQNETIGGADVNESLLAGTSRASFASHDPGDFVIPGGPTQVIALTDGRNGGLLTVPQHARLLVNATLTLVPSGPGYFGCYLAIAPFGGSYARISQEVFGYDPTTPIPLTGATDVAPGTYNAQAACLSNQGAATFVHGDLTALAISR